MQKQLSNRVNDNLLSHSYQALFDRKRMAAGGAA